MGIKKINGGVEDFINKFVRSRGGDSTGLDAVGAGGVEPASTNPDGHTATGGIISDWVDPSPGNVYRTHIFTSTGVFDVSSLSGTYPAAIDYLVVGGGGGGGGAHEAGGGGAGGAASPASPDGMGISGSQSALFPTPQSYPHPSYIRSEGGGGGGTYISGPPFAPAAGISGGSGGGSANRNSHRSWNNRRDYLVTIDR